MFDSQIQNDHFIRLSSNMYNLYLEWIKSFNFWWAHVLWFCLFFSPPVLQVLSLSPDYFQFSSPFRWKSGQCVFFQISRREIQIFLCIWKANVIFILPQCIPSKTHLSLSKFSLLFSDIGNISKDIVWFRFLGVLSNWSLPKFSNCDTKSWWKHKIFCFSVTKFAIKQSKILRALV